MFTKVEELAWTRWLVQQISSGQLVIRLRIEKSRRSHTVQAMLAYGDVTRHRSLAGVVMFNSEAEKMSSGVGVPVPIKCSLFSGDTSAWGTLIPLPDDCYQLSWMRQTATLCLHRESSGDNWQAVSPGGFLALRYLTQLHGMVYQAFASTEDKDSELVLGMIEAHLSQVLDHKFQDIASLMAGVN